MRKIFISYSHKDREFVAALALSLSRRYDLRVDIRNIIPDVPLIEQISAFIDTCDYFVPVISRNSATSNWVRHEIAQAHDKSLKRKTLLLPIILGRTKPPSYLAVVPYVRFPNPKNRRSYTRCLHRLAQYVARNPIISGKLVLHLFSTFGGLVGRPHGEFGLAISTRGTAKGASGLCFDQPLHVTGFKKLQLRVENSKTSDFSGWSARNPKMLKVEINEVPIQSLRRSFQTRDDKDYIKPMDGVIEYELPKIVRRSGFTTKLDLVFGKGRISNLRIQATFV